MTDDRFEDRFVPHAETCKLLGGVHPDTLDAWVRSGHLPPPVRLSRKTRGWPLSVLVKVMRGEFAPAKEQA